MRYLAPLLLFGLTLILGCGGEEPVEEPIDKKPVEKIEFKRSKVQNCHFEGHVDGVIDEVKLTPIMAWADLKNAKQLLPFGDAFLALDEVGLKMLNPNDESTLVILEAQPTSNIVSIASDAENVFIASDTSGRIQVRKHRLENDMLDAGSVMLTVSDVLSLTLSVDSESNLIIAVGETEEEAINSEFARDGKTIQGAILRINPDDPMTPIPSNPSYGASPGQVFAVGVRNPAGCTLDHKDNIWCADMGPTSAEIHRVKKASNLGWPEFDGSACARSPNCKLQLDQIPQAKFERKDASCGIIMGSLYASAENPVLQKTIYFANTCENQIHALLLASPDRYWWDGPTGKVEGKITGMGSDKEGNVFVLSEKGIYKIGIKNDGTFPKRISESGCFGEKGKTKGMIPYDVKAVLWTDGATKDRWIEIPPNTMIDVSDPAKLVFPEGSVLAKNFSFIIEDELVVKETRVMVKGAFGWEFHTYKWNEDGSDADLLSEKDDAQLTTTFREESLQVRHLFPDRANCRMCHGLDLQVLGPRLDQMDKTFTIQGNAFDGLTLLKDVKYIPADAKVDVPIPDYEDESVSVEKRARAFLHTNCAHCHRPGGWKPSSLEMDLRFETSFIDTKTCDIQASSGSILVQNPRISPGDAKGSVLYQRLTDLGLDQMPPIGRSVIPEAGAEVVKAWINNMESCPE